ncbi:hypothetical protein G4B88_021898 [Cannabis sativa]|uniref:Uncharacterized protein n=1 Tax=Cannabis sativa TaxID=3483 RepID=A0A7J6GZ10_CANSA|nr:hypothetical protein G4B88_021898 [Cannabis sativa]
MLAKHPQRILLQFIAAMFQHQLLQLFAAMCLVLLCPTSLVLIAVNDESGGPARVSRSKYIISFICTLAASTIYSLLLSLMQLSFQKVLKRETFSVVLEMQIYTSLVAICAALAGFAYVNTLVWTAVAWKVCSVTSLSPT